MSRLRWSALVLTVVLLAACGAAPLTPTPGLLGALPAPPTLPPAETVTPALPTPTPRPTATPTPTPLPPTPTPTPTPTVLSSLLLPGGYLTAAASLFATPGGGVLATLPAGARVGLLGRSADGVWFQALYQPDPGRPPQRGWVRAESVAVFADRDRLAVIAAAPSAGAATPSGEETVTVLADRLNLREGPGQDRPVIGVLRRGETVTVQARSADGAWLRVRTAAGQEGWVAAAFVGREGAAPAGTVRSVRRSLLVQPRLGGDFYVLSWPDGTLRRLSTGLDPALSPDGRLVAFTRWDEPRGLWVIGSDGRGERLVFGANRGRLPTWSPDGRAIVLEIGLGSRQCHQTPFGCLTAAEWQARFGAECVPTPLGRVCLGDFAVVTLEETTLVRVNLDDGSIRHLPVGNRAQAPAYHPH
ncbi:MAG: SH3 domain-containing protein, partial [Caldilineales bacterium]|nr:SH3 domain-containing protein [Caldilineales bacterium]